MRAQHRAWSRALVTGAAALLAAGLSATAAQAQEGPVRGAGQPGAIADSYIVVLKDGASASLANRYGAQVKQTYQKVLNGFSARMDAKQARRLAADPAVAYVQQDGVATAAGTQDNPTWGLDRIDQAALPLDKKYTYPDHAGAGVTAYVLDTGARLSHAEFEGRAKNGYDFIDNDAVANDCNGHGTHVAGTIGGKTYGVAKKVNLVAVRVLDCQGNGEWSQVIGGIDWVAQNATKPAVANMSLGGGANSAVDDAVKKAIGAGITFAVASGNSNTNACNTSPARTPEAITVNATDSSDNRSSFSNYGSCTDLFAPGTSVTSSWYTGDTATNTISGTSMATPHVAGAAALHLAANTSATPAQVRDALVRGATHNAVKNPGSGSPNELLRVGATTQPPTCAGATNTDDVAIPDAGAAVTSSVEVKSCEGNAPAGTKVAVSIRHPYTGDLVIDLVGPSGKAYNLKQAGGASTINLNSTYAVNASAEPKAGTWTLRVRDVYAYDTGSIDSFGVSF
ncbi:S8 family peptidase [Amycolatopsis sp. 195334CR]|uniref:S8 family peptidase n=1 Tax=Amycolatopsis sp. 195334CR TaxID=2814588 RepID=UPI001A8EFE87|nr:S8 family peptidase [Amycolatopsis sp. 195334CR]MBN6037218.1 S8 family peptidase [Amycolatopsis sp. 195334CR]